MGTFATTAFSQSLSFIHAGGGITWNMWIPPWRYWQMPKGFQRGLSEKYYRITSLDAMTWVMLYSKNSTLYFERSIGGWYGMYGWRDRTNSTYKIWKVPGEPRNGGCFCFSEQIVFPRQIKLGTVKALWLPTNCENSPCSEHIMVTLCLASR